ncbi:MAG: hypothetical protein K2N27_04930 [Ruminococcus sp.]|nr:hypothetical protein [Ruminococcus sp.]
MAERNTNQVKNPLYKKAIGVGIMIAVAIYCIPELQDKLISALNLNGEWRKTR